MVGTVTWEEGYKTSDEVLSFLRYGLSKYLKQLDLPFFKDFSLGRISHVVQLAISQKFLLAYEDNVLKPVPACAVFANALLVRHHATRADSGP